MDENLQQQLRELLNTQSLGVLATSSGGHPYTSLVGFAASEDLREIFFVTSRTTRKYANLSGDERVTLLIDNRSNQAEDFHLAAALTAFGTAREVDAEMQTELKRQYLRKHPLLKEFVSSPSCALCRISVQSYSLVRRFQDVVELVLNDADPSDERPALPTRKIAAQSYRS